METKPTEERSNPNVNGTDDIVESQATSNTSPSATAEDLRPKSLWDEAYKALRTKETKLIVAYEKDLLASQDAHQQGTSGRIGYEFRFK